MLYYILQTPPKDPSHIANGTVKIRQRTHGFIHLVMSHHYRLWNAEAVKFVAKNLWCDEQLHSKTVIAKF